MPLIPTVPSLPSATQNTQSLLASMSSLNGVITDYNIGSIIRTISESLGYVIEEQGAEIATLALQTIIYGAYTAYGIYPLSAISSTGTITFLTSTSVGPPPASQSILIPQGTIVQTAGGVQFQTSQNTILASGSSYISVGISATVPGSGSNVPASSIIQIVNGLAYPLFCLNGSPTAGGSPSEPPAQTASRFAAAVAKPGLASPVAVADAAIGIIYPSTSEEVLYSACWESGIASGVPGFILLIDNGTGGASSGLINAVTGYINAPPQYRPVGVPYIVSGATPVYVNVSISGTLFPQYEGNNSTVMGSVVSGVQSYFSSLSFAQTSYQGQIAAYAGNSSPGLLDSLTVSLNSGASSVSALPYERVILQSINVVIN